MNPLINPHVPIHAIDWQELDRRAEERKAARLERARTYRRLSVRPCTSVHWCTPSDDNPSLRTYTVVRNLGWLLCHWRDVDILVVEDGPKDPTRLMQWGAFLVAYDRERNPLYSTPFASRSVLRDWLDRPVFRGLPVNWLGAVEEIGSETYRQAPSMVTQ